MRLRPIAWRKAAQRLLLAAAIAAWAGVAAWGFHALAREDFTAGPAGSPAPTWPESATLLRDPRRPTLVMFAHPRCPCTRASLDELAEVMARAPGRFRAYVVFFEPEAADRAWARGRSWDKAAAIKGV